MEKASAKSSLAKPHFFFFFLTLTILEEKFFLKKPKIESQKQITGELQTYAQIAAKGNAKLIHKCIRNPKSTRSSSSGRPLHV